VALPVKLNDLKDFLEEEGSERLFIYQFKIGSLLAVSPLVLITILAYSKPNTSLGFLNISLIDFAVLIILLYGSIGLNIAQKGYNTWNESSYKEANEKQDRKRKLEAENHADEIESENSLKAEKEDEDVPDAGDLFA